MIRLFRQILVISLLYLILLFVGNIIINKDLHFIITLVKLGFIILSASTLGEIAENFKLPKVLGYLLAGFIFGNTFSSFLNIKPVITNDLIHKVNLLNETTISLFAILIGLSSSKDIIYSHKSFFIKNNLISTFLIFFILAPIIFFVTIYSVNISLFHISDIIIASVFLSILIFNTSFEFNYSLVKENYTESFNANFINSFTVNKELFTYFLFIITLIILSLLNFVPNNADVYIIAKIFISVFMGIILALITIFYTKYIKSEILIFIITLAVLGSEACRYLQLNNFITFLTAGIILNKYLLDKEQFKTFSEKVLAPLLIIYFVFFESHLDEFIIKDLFLTATLILIALTILKLLSFKLTSIFENNDKDVLKLSNFSFYSLGFSTLILINYVNFMPKAAQLISNLVVIILFLNSFLSSILFKLGKYFTLNKTETVNSEIKIDKLIEEKEQLNKINKTRIKFEEPNIADLYINKSLYKILFELNNIFGNFEKKFILSRSEESAELIIEITEYYTEEYLKLKNIILKIGNNYSSLKNELLKSEERTINLYLTLTESRKATEKKILLLESLIKDIFHSLSDLTDTLSEYAEVKINPDNLKTKKGNNFKLLLVKLYYLLKYNTLSKVKKDYSVYQTIYFKNLVKYYLLGQSANEILETVNLVGIERLNTLRQIKKLFDHQIENINELIKLLDDEKDNPAFENLVYDRFEELHNQYINEITAIQTEINETGTQISNRLRYALANPYNSLVNTLNNLISFNTAPVKYKYSKIFVEGERARETALETIRYWINYYLGFLGLFQKSALIYKLQTDLNSVINLSLGQIVSEINNHIKLLITDLNTKIRQLKQDLKSADLDFSKLIDKANLLLLHDSLNKQLNALEIIKKSKKFNLLIEELIKNFGNISKKLPENIYLLKETDLILTGRLPQFIELKSVPIKAAAKSSLEFKLPREIGEVNEMLINYLNLCILEIKNIFSIVDYHLSTADKESKKEIDEIQKNLILEIIESLFDKLKLKTKQLEEEVNRLDKNLIIKISEKVNFITKEIDGIIEFRLNLTKNQKALKDSSENPIKKLIWDFIFNIKYTFKKAFINVARFYRLYLKNIVLKSLVYFGFKKEPEEVYESQSIYFNEKVLAKLPFIYRKLFDGAPLETSDFFIGREKFSEIVNTAFNKHNENKPASLIIIGEPGSGKKSLINTIKNVILKDYDTIHYQLLDSITSPDELLLLFSKLLGFTKQLTKDELIAELNNKSNRRIFLIENIGKLYLRKYKGYEALKLFKVILTATQSNTYWICTSGKYVWNFYSSNFGLDEVFTEKIYTNLTHKKDIRSILLSRHNATGFDLEFKASDFNKLKSKFFKIKSKTVQQEELKNQFFDKLEEYAEGNIISAMYYWLISVEKIDGNKLILSPPKRVYLKIFEELNQDYFVILAIIFKHGWLTDTDIADMLFADLSEIKTALNYLANLELIYKDKLDLSSDKYFINKFVYKIIESELLKRNLI